MKSNLESVQFDSPVLPQNAELANPALTPTRCGHHCINQNPSSITLKTQSFFQVPSPNLDYITLLCTLGQVLLYLSKNIILKIRILG